MKRLLQLLSLAALALTLSAPALAAGDGGRVPLPTIPAAKGEKCVEDTDVMRRNHMDFLKHHRDDTMHRGIRTTKHSLKACIDCHVPAEGDMTNAAKSEGHFCQNCHVYAGVTLDCFECHATKPEKSAQFHPMVSPGTEAMKAAEQTDSAALLNQLAGSTENKTGVANE